MPAAPQVSAKNFGHEDDGGRRIAKAQGNVMGRAMLGSRMLVHVYATSCLYNNMIMHDNALKEVKYLEILQHDG